MKKTNGTGRQYAPLIAKLRNVGLRPTKQRLALAKILFGGEGHRHISAEQLHEEAARAGVSVSLATVYNTLHQFTDAGLLRELVIMPGRTYFDTNTHSHHHFFSQSTGELIDIEQEDISLSSMPAPPEGASISGVHVVVYLD